MTQCSLFLGVKIKAQVKAVGYTLHCQILFSLCGINLITFFTDCGNIIYHDHSGTVKSPNYPGDYPTNVDCIWQIIVDPAYHVDVDFDDDFYIEHSDGCLYDYVAVG